MNTHVPKKFIFEPLQERDLDFLCEWLSREHVKEWCDRKLTPAEIKNKYRKTINTQIVFPFIVYLDDKPIGFIQYYYANKLPNGWFPDEMEGTIGIDQFIGEKNYINRGCGSQIIGGLIQKLFERSAIKKIIIYVNSNNQRAIRCYKKASLRIIDIVKKSGREVYLMAIYKNLLIEPHAPLLKKPTPKAPLYKIIKTKHFIDMLEKNYLYFRRVDTYHDDQRDSDQPDKDKEISEKSTFEKAPNFSLKDYYNKCRSRTYACCFSTEKTEHLWKHYAGKSQNAVCLVFDSSKLINFLNSKFGQSRLIYNGKKYKNFFFINYGLVTYKNFDSQFIDERCLNPIQYVYFKDASKYSEEKEFRISLSCIGMPELRLPDGSNFSFPESVLFCFDFIKAINIGVIEKIYLSDEHDSSEAEKVRKKLESKIPIDDVNRILD